MIRLMVISNSIIELIDES